MTKLPVTLYCLPFAGGNSLSYRALNAHLPEFIKLKTLELPGRNNKIKQPLISQIDELVDILFKELKPELISNQDYGFFGHSMGALLAYLLTQRIESEAYKKPIHLFCSGRRAPSVNNNNTPRHLLSKPAFFEYLDELGGIPEEVRKNEELMAFFEPIIRADFKVVDSYQYSKASPLTTSLTVLYGQQDNETPIDYILPWQQESTKAVDIKAYEGGHFFILDHLPQLGQLFSNNLVKTIN